MLRTVPAISFVVLACGAATPAAAQSCLGYPSFATSRFNVSTDIVVGADFGGLGLDANYGTPRNGPFGSVGVGGTRFVTEPKENRFNYGGLVGWERHNKDQLIWCPFISAAAEHGQSVDRGNGGLEKISGTILGAGLGIAFELERRGRLSFNPFINARYTRLNTKSTGAVNAETVETGATFGFGLGVRINEAIQITPSMNGATFEGANLVFDLRFSLALQKK